MFSEKWLSVFTRNGSLKNGTFIIQNTTDY